MAQIQPEQLIEIQINSSDKNKDKAFEIISGCQLPVVALDDEKYVVPESFLETLKKEGVQALKKDGAKWISIGANGVKQSASENKG